MPFQLERDMYSTTLEHLPALLPCEAPYAYGLEVPLSHKIADIGFIPCVCRSNETSEARSLARLELTGLWALARMLELDEIAVSDFWSFLGSSLTKREKERITSSLCKSGVLEQSDQGQLSPGNWLTRQVGSIIFVELKLSRWEEALAQARFYLEMADMACVVLGGEFTIAVPEERFAEEGIGLFAAWPERLDMLVAPKLNQHVSPTHRNFNRLRAVQDLSRQQPKKWMVA